MTLDQTQVLLISSRRPTWAAPEVQAGFKRFPAEMWPPMKRELSPSWAMIESAWLMWGSLDDWITLGKRWPVKQSSFACSIAESSIVTVQSFLMKLSRLFFIFKFNQVGYEFSNLQENHKIKSLKFKYRLNLLINQSIFPLSILNFF